MADINPTPDNGPNPFTPIQSISTSTTVGGPPASPDALYPPEGPDPKGTTAEQVEKMEEGVSGTSTRGAGVEGEEVVWEASYSMKNFAGRITLRVVLTIAWIALAVETWGNSHESWAPVTYTALAVLVFLWVALLYRMAQARYGHYYRLTNRRLFVSTGLMRRRRDQMELLRVKDVFTRQTLSERWMSLGSVVVVSSEKELPIFYITGVDDPKQVMDLIWHHARAERDTRSTKIDSV